MNTICTIVKFIRPSKGAATAEFNKILFSIFYESLGYV